MTGTPPAEDAPPTGAAHHPPAFADHLTPPVGAARATNDRVSSHRVITLVAAAAGATTTAAMIATPLFPQGGRGRRLLSSVVVTGAFVTTTANAARRWGWRRSAAAAGATAVATGLVERLGTATGWPFGRYAYTGLLRPHIAGVPAIVPLAWFAVGLPARETASAALGPTAPRAARVALGSLALTAWDVFLDPQMVGEGFWRWGRRGAYRGIPLSNFVGWFTTGLGVMGLLEALLDPTSNDGGAAPADAALVGEYGFTAVMQTVGFAAFFRDRVVAVVGGTAMLPIAIGGLVGLRRG